MKQGRLFLTVFKLSRCVQCAVLLLWDLCWPGTECCFVLGFWRQWRDLTCLNVVHAFLCQRNALNWMMIVYVMVACAVKLLSLFAGWLPIRCWLMPWCQLPCTPPHPTPEMLDDWLFMLWWPVPWSCCQSLFCAAPWGAGWFFMLWRRMPWCQSLFFTAL